jgi:hypothetical protein
MTFLLLSVDDVTWHGLKYKSCSEQKDYLSKLSDPVTSVPEEWDKGRSGAQ